MSPTTLYGFPSSGSPFSTPLDQSANMNNFLPASEDLAPRIFLFDIDGDGRDEIHYNPGTITLVNHHYHIYRPDGTPWGYNTPLHTGYGHGYSADIDGDGIGEIYGYTDRLIRLDTTGQPTDTAILAMDGHPYQLRDMSAVDIDKDGKHELIVYGYLDISPWEHLNYWLYAFDENLTLKPGWPHEIKINAYLVPTNPVFADLDGDGSLEYITSHYDFSSGLVYAWRLDGTPYLGDSLSDGFFATTSNPAIFAFPSVADVDGDNTMDVIVPADKDLLGSYAVERILAYRNDASLIDGFPLVVYPDVTGVTYSFHSAVVGDVDEDGLLDMFYPSNAGRLVFTEFNDASYHPAKVPVQMWRYNRKLNGMPPVFDPESLLCGDVNASGGVPDVADLTYLVDYLFRGGSAPPFVELADVDSSSQIDVVDLTTLVAYLFFDGTLNCP